LDESLPLEGKWHSAIEDLVKAASGRNVFQILQKRGIATEAKFRYGIQETEVYQSAHGRRLSGFSRIHTINACAGGE